MSEDESVFSTLEKVYKAIDLGEREREEKLLQLGRQKGHEGAIIPWSSREI
jgi:hypothetical protein